jgi:hypothetical protein
MFATLPAQPATFFSDTFEFRQLARIPYYGIITCGDADHDGLQEFYAIAQWFPHDAYIIEFNPDMNYDTLRLPKMWNSDFCFIGDIDRDRKTDLVIIDENCELLVYESETDTSLPLRRVWSHQIGGWGGDPIVTDLDRDGCQEIIFHHNNIPPPSIAIFENVGDNCYAFKKLFPETIPARPTKAFGYTPDIDRDGLPELFRITSGVVVYEAVGNDTFVIRAIRPLPIPAQGDCAPVAGSADIDGDGRNEAIIFVTDYLDESMLAIFESPVNDSIEMVWDTLFPANHMGGATLSVGDVTGDGIPEIALGYSGNICLFRCSGNDRYEEFWHKNVAWNCANVGLYDLNNDGKAEVILTENVDDLYTTIYEYFPLGLVEQQHKALEQVKISPSIVAKGKPVVFDQLPEGARVEILDITGRVLAEPDRLWQTRAINPGAYFVRLKLGGQTLTRKLLVVK